MTVIRPVRGWSLVEPAGPAKIGAEARAGAIPRPQMQELSVLHPPGTEELSPAEVELLAGEVRALAAERNAVIPAHNYHLLERGQRRGARLARARPRSRDSLRPRHVARLVRRPRARPGRRPRALPALPRLGRRVPRPRRHPPRRHLGDARRASGRGVLDP